jgi:hypothetical protein
MKWRRVKSPLSGILVESFPATKALFIILTGAMAMRPATLRELIDLCH